MARIQLATRKQIGSVVTLLVSGKASREDAQAFIDRFKDVPSVKKRRKQEPATDPNLVVFWDERYPGKGEAIMEILRPFCGWKPERKPALPDLEERAKAAIFWRDIKDVRVFDDPISLRASLEDSLRASL
ncbi:hypothetical protein KJ925_02330, partial [Patescibacteria group bacterium]|nr:hypothetical protein [Patescibacteria group bacterium]